MRPPAPPPPNGRWPEPPSAPIRPEPERPPSVSHRLPPAPPPLLLEKVFKPLAVMEPLTVSRPLTVRCNAPPPLGPVPLNDPPRGPVLVGLEELPVYNPPVAPAPRPP